MGSTRRSFTEEYKAAAVAFVLDDGRSIAEVSRNVGCHEVTLGGWVIWASPAPPDVCHDDPGPAQAHRESPGSDCNSVRKWVAA